MINWRSRRLDFQNMLSCQNCWFKLICNPNVPKHTYPRDDRHTAVKTRHGVQSRQSRGPPRLDTWTRESQWLRPTAAAGCCFIFQPVGYWWPVGGIATTSNQPILELQFMQWTQMAQPAWINIQKGFKILVPSVVARAAKNKSSFVSACFFEALLISLLSQRHCPQSVPTEWTLKSKTPP